jgi:hypothetical protein
MTRGGRCHAGGEVQRRGRYYQVLEGNRNAVLPGFSIQSSGPLGNSER